MIGSVLLVVAWPSASVPFLTLGVAGSAAILGGALALGIRHGIDWDHIAAITDITSTSASAAVQPNSWLVNEPGVQLADESRHGLALSTAPAGGATAALHRPAARITDGPGKSPRAWVEMLRAQHRPLLLGTMYALGHGSMVVGLGLLAILFRQILPAWVDPLMERVVGVTLLFLSVYLFYSLFRYFRDGEDFQIRSRWMLVFAAVGNLTHRIGDTFRPSEHHHHIDTNRQYGARTAYGIGLIHGIGAETGTQVLIIGTAVGATSKGMGVVTLFAFVFGLLISNSVVTVMTTTGFSSAHRRQLVYVVVGAVAAVFSLVVGLAFLAQSTSLLPNLDQWFQWIGGPRR